MHETLIAHAGHYDGLNDLYRAEPFAGEAELNIYAAGYAAGVNERLAKERTLDLREADKSIM